MDKFAGRMFALISFTCRNLVEHRPEILSCFAALIEGEIVAPEEFLLLTMHELRLPEVLELAHAWAAKDRQWTRALDRLAFSRMSRAWFRED